MQFTKAMFQLLGKGSQSTQRSKQKNTKITKSGQIPSTLQHRVLWQLKKQSRPWWNVRLHAEEFWLLIINHLESVVQVSFWEKYLVPGFPYAINNHWKKKKTSQRSHCFQVLDNSTRKASPNRQGTLVVLPVHPSNRPGGNSSDKTQWAHQVHAEHGGPAELKWQRWRFKAAETARNCGARHLREENYNRRASEKFMLGS